jgi:hypothetical protein
MSIRMGLCMHVVSRLWFRRGKEGQRALLLLLVVFVFGIEVFGVSVEMVSCDSMLEQNLP